MENLSDYLYGYLKTIEVEPDEREALIKYIDTIVDKSSPLYSFLKEITNDNSKRDIVINEISKLIRGEDV